MKYVVLACLCWILGGPAVAAAPPSAAANQPDRPYLVVLGISQDGGVPQAGSKDDPRWDDPRAQRMACSVAIVDPGTAQRWLIDATPDFREQLHVLDTVYPVDGKPGLDGIFLTHAHVGHYMGLLHLGHEVMGAQGVAVFAMPRMAAFLLKNGPWDQLVRYRNIVLEPLAADVAVPLNDHLAVTPLLVPHRQEYSEVVGYRIEGPQRTALYIPDIDRWEAWDAQGVSIEALVAEVDVAYLDGTFYDLDELPGRDMSQFPHPPIAKTMERFATLPDSERAKVRFIHLNHTNPALNETSAARRQIENRGFQVAQERERFDL